jgi:hypothetical protein
MPERRQHGQGIDSAAPPTQLEVQMITGRVPGVPHSRYDLATSHPIAFPYQVPGVVGIE